MTITPPPTDSLSEYTLELPPPDGLLGAFLGELVEDLSQLGCSTTVLFVYGVGMLVTLLCLSFRFAKDNLCHGRKETTRAKVHHPMWRSLLALHTYLSLLAPCHYRCAFLHAMQLTFHLLCMLLVAGLLLGHMQGRLWTVVVIACVAPVVTMPLKAVVNYIAFVWFYDDRDVMRAVLGRERVAVTAPSDAFQFDFYGQQTQHSVPAYKVRQEQARSRRQSRRARRVVTPDPTPETDSRFFTFADFTVLPGESAAAFAAVPASSAGDDAFTSSRGEHAARPPQAGARHPRGHLYLNEIEVQDDMEEEVDPMPKAAPGFGKRESATDGEADDAMTERTVPPEKPVPLDVTIHTYTTYLGWALALLSFLVCWATIRAIGSVQAAMAHCVNGTLDTIFLASVVVDNVICEPLYLGAVYILRDADALSSEAVEGDDGSSSSSSGNEDGLETSSSSSSSSDGSSHSSCSGTSSERRRHRRRTKRKAQAAAQRVFTEIHPIDGCLRRIFIPPEVDDLFNSVQVQRIDEFSRRLQHRHADGSGGGGGGGSDDGAGLDRNGIPQPRALGVTSIDISVSDNSDDEDGDEDEDDGSPM